MLAVPSEVVAPSNLYLVLEFIGIFVFAIAGGLVGVRARLDVFGVAVLAWVTGLGGGIIRDVFIGDIPPQGISNPWYIVTVLSAGAAVFLFYSVFVDLSQKRPQLRLNRIGEAVKFLDAVGLASFAVAGSVKAINFGAPPLACVFVGTITAVGGGMVRDVLAGQVPEVLRREIYALPALLGSVVVVVANLLDLLSVAVVWLAFSLVLGIRVTAIVLDLNAPTSPENPTFLGGRT